MRIVSTPLGVSSTNCQKPTSPEAILCAGDSCMGEGAEPFRPAFPTGLGAQHPLPPPPAPHSRSQGWAHVHPIKCLLVTDQFLWEQAVR